MGYLTGKINTSKVFNPNSDLRSGFPRFTSEAIKANRPVVDLLSAIAKEKKATPAQIELAWLLAQKPWVVPIPGTTKLEHLKENLGAVNVGLTSEDLLTIENQFSKIKIQGARSTQALLALSDDMS